jgi:DNA repair photolyase
MKRIANALFILPYLCMLTARIVSRKILHLSVNEIRARTILTPQHVGSLSGHYDFSLNPYAGCAFACSYCYVPKFPGAHNYSEWGEWVQVKVNAPELIRNERTQVFGSRIFFSSATDPYQYLELKYRLTRRCLQELYLYKPSMLTLHTRSHLMLQDLELLKSFGSNLQVGVSITTDDDAIRHEFEPKAPSIRRRLQLLQKLNESGIRAYVSAAPLLPCNPLRLARLIANLADRIWIGEMNYPEINRRPDLLKKYASYFEPSNYQRTTDTLVGAFNSAQINPSRGWARRSPSPLPLSAPHSIS